MVSRKHKERLKQLVPKGVVQVYHNLRQSANDLYYWSCSIVYRGSTYYCPFCGQSFSRFFPDGDKASVIRQYGVIGGGYRNNCLCPNCLSKDRERLLLLYLQQQSTFFDAVPKSVLHIAPEKNLKELFKQKDYLQYVNADLNPGAADVQMDITDIHYPDSSFDFILCNHVLEHIPNDIQAMRELYRVLKPGGQAILQVPFAENLQVSYEDPTITLPSDREAHFGQFDHVRIYGHDYLQRLSSVGFNVSVYTAQEMLGNSIVQRLSLIPDEKIFVGRK